MIARIGMLISILGMLAMAAQADVRGPVRQTLDVANPNVQNWVQESGSVRINITNRGYIGNSAPQQAGAIENPCPPGNWAPQTEFPIGSGQQYLYHAGLWIGAEIIDGEETHPRVSVGTDGWFSPSINEFFPGETTDADVVLRSNLPEATDCFGNSIYDPNARANFESIAVLADTLTDRFWVVDDPVDGQHEPLGIEITQSALTWFSPDFSNLMIIEYIVRNISDHDLRNVYLGFYADADCGPATQLEHHTDDITGFLRIDPVSGDTLNIGWAADNDGRPPESSSGPFDNPHSMGVFALSDATTARASYNWWVSNGDVDLDYGPAWSDYADEDSLNMGWAATYGTPVSDERKYQVLFNGEQDFDQVYVADSDWIVSHPQDSYDPVCDRTLDETWSTIDTPTHAQNISNGFDTRFMMSWGPLGIFDFTDANGCDVYRLNSGEEFTFTLGYLLGPDFHDPDNPQPSIEVIDPSLFDYSGLIASARAAQFLYEHNYEGIVAPPENFAPTVSADAAVPLAWSSPSSGTISGFQLFGVNQAAPDDTVQLNEALIIGESFTADNLTTGDEWRLLLRTIDLDSFRSGFVDTLVRVGAVLPVTNLTASLEGATVHLAWNSSNDPALESYTVARRSILGDSVTFTVTDNSFTDDATVSGRYYDYWIITESTFGVTGVPTPPVQVLPFAPQEQILVIEESRPLSPIDPLLGGISPDSIRAAYDAILTEAGYTYDLIIQTEGEELVFGLETLATYDVVIWHGEGNSAIYHSYVFEKENILSDYATAGGHLIRAGRRILNNNMGINPGEQLRSNFLSPLCIDSVRAFSRISFSSPDHVQFDGASSLDARFPGIRLNPDRVAQIILGSTPLGFVNGVEPIWPCGSTWSLYSIEVQETDSSGFEGEPCGVISENVILLTFPLYFVVQEDAVAFMMAAIEGLRENAFDIPDPPGTPIPKTIALHQNYPNPFNPTTTISFSLPAMTQVTLKVFDIMGRVVTTLLNEQMSGGEYSVSFEGGKFASGIYFYRLQAGSDLQTRKMILLK